VTRVVSYDRAGSAWSDLGDRRLAPCGQEAFELHLALDRSGIKPPYVLVGHSLGGLVARVYAHMYANEVRGIILVDATHENTR